MPPACVTGTVSRASTSVSVNALVRDAAWLAHRFDPTGDTVHFLPVDRAAHDRATFLTDEYLPAHDPLVVARREAMAAGPPAAPVHFLFHAAFCCSTLAARAFDIPGRAMALKEPVILNDITGWRRRGAGGPDVAEVLRDALALLGRPFHLGEAVVVKPSNATHGLDAAMLALRPESRAVLLYAPLPTFLASVARKGLDGRLWVRTLLLGLCDDGLVRLGFDVRDHLGQTDLQVAAVGWLAQQALFADLVARFGAQRVRTLSSEALTADPARAVTAMYRLFEIPVADDEVTAVIEGPVFRRHAKFGGAFAPADRAREERDGAALHADEIAKVLGWADAAAAAAGVPRTPPAPLLA